MIVEFQMDRAVRVCQGWAPLAYRRIGIPGRVWLSFIFRYRSACSGRLRLGLLVMSGVRGSRCGSRLAGSLARCWGRVPAGWGGAD